MTRSSTASVCALIASCLATPGVTHAQELAADTRVPVRLRQPVSSFGSERDSRITAHVIAPVAIDGRVVVPLGAELLGHVDGTRRVGLGLSRETAFVDLSFDTLRFPDGQEIPFAARVAAVDNARETVDARGRIQGIRATASFASMLTGVAVSAGAVDPMLLGWTVSSSVSVFRMPESEVILPTGTELHVKVLQPITLTRTFDPPVPAVVATADETAALAALVAALPFRTVTAGTKIPSDLTNLVLVGSREAVIRAFDAAGWGQTDELSARSSYAALRAIVENQGYREAPMSILLLDGQAPSLTYAKTLNTFFQRHHLRVFARPETFGGMAVWTVSSTHDSGIGFATKAKAFIHVIDQNIDEERDKVGDDLILTGCVQGQSLVDRPWIPRDATNATGDKLVTDGRVAVVRLTDCAAPTRADASVAAGPSVRPTPNGAERVMRDVTLWLRNDAFRGNIIYQVYSGARMGLGKLFGHHEPVAERTVHYAGEEFKIVPGAQARRHELAPDDPADRRPSFHPIERPRRTFTSQLEFSVSGGASGFGNSAFSTQTINTFANIGGVPTLLASVDAESELDNRWAFAVRTTLNPHRYVSHEFGYSFSRTALHVANLGTEIETIPVTAPAQIRQFNYNLLVHVRPNGQRVRPYFSIGPGLQVVRLSDALSTRTRVLRVAFREVDLLAGTWNFGSTPPLEGGGIFQPALQYGGGVKFHLSPHVHIRSDFRETLSPQPDFWTKSHPSLTIQVGETTRIEPGRLTLAGPLRHHVFTVGMGVAF
jgi:hypothetical protein